jgi:hypothetical protein
VWVKLVNMIAGKRAGSRPGNRFTPDIWERSTFKDEDIRNINRQIEILFKTYSALNTIVQLVKIVLDGLNVRLQVNILPSVSLEKFLVVTMLNLYAVITIVFKKAN